MVGVGEGLYGGAMSSTRGFRDFNSQPQGLRLSADTIPPSIEEEVRTAIWNQIVPVSYTHLTLPTTPYV